MAPVAEILFPATVKHLPDSWRNTSSAGAHIGTTVQIAILAPTDPQTHFLQINSSNSDARTSSGTHTHFVGSISGARTSSRTPLDPHTETDRYEWPSHDAGSFILAI